LEFPSSRGVLSSSAHAPAPVGISDDLPAHVARELHDQVAQPLIALVLEIYELRTQTGLDASVAAQVQHIEDSARRVLRQTREMLIDLRGPGELRLNFVQVLRSELVRGASDVVPSIHATSRWPKHINGWAAFNLLRIAQESTANAVRHGRARKIDVFLDTNAEQEAVMVVIDDGVRIPDASSGFGMVGMSERAVILGGTFSSAMRETGGTRVEVRVPAQRLE
jgi:two-component system, NarL family, sensor histidine kinase UhpB